MMPIMMLMIILIIPSCNLTGSPEINIKEVKLVPSRALIGVASAYLIINNKGQGSDKLTGCLIKDMPSVKCRLHDVVDGKMVHVDSITLPAGKTTFLRKGSKHLMLYGLPEGIEKDLPLTLNFKKSGPFDIVAAIDKG